MTLELLEGSPPFDFDSDAHEVFDFILDGKEARGIRRLDGSLTFFCGLDSVQSPKAAYVIGVTVSISNDSPNVKTPQDKGNWLVWEKELAEITLSQNVSGKCEARLYIETDPRRWNRDGGDSPLNLGIGKTLLVQLWCDVIIERWVKRRLAVIEPAAAQQPTPSVALGNGLSAKGEPMVTKFLYIKDDVPVFVTWLDDVTSDVCLRRFPTVRGYIILDGLPSPLPTTPPFPAKMFIELTGRRVFVDDDGQEEAQLETPWLIRFVILYGRETLEVKAECQEPAVMGFFDELIQAASLRWLQPGTTSAGMTGAALDALTTPTSGAANTAQPASAALGDGQGKEKTAGDIPTIGYSAKLRQNLAKHFDKDELRTLCFDLGIEHENLPETKDGMARELVAYCDRTGRIPELVTQCRKLRPNVSWEEVP